MGGIDCKLIAQKENSPKLDVIYTWNTQEKGWKTHLERWISKKVGRHKVLKNSVLKQLEKVVKDE